jgi:hypothetical protein
MVAKKRKGILKKGIRRGEQGINPLLVALGAGAGAAGGAGMGARRAMQTEARVPQVAAKMAKRAISQFEVARNEGQYQRGEAMKSERAADDIRMKKRRNYFGVSEYETGRMIQNDNEGFERRGRAGVADRNASRIQNSGRMLSGLNESKIERKLAAVGNKASTRRTKRLAGKGAIKGGVLAALAQAVLAEINKKKG